MKLLKLLSSLIFIIAMAILCQQIISNSIANQNNKNDYAEINSIKYGLLSVNEWKEQVTVILAEEINKMYLSNENRRVLRNHLKVLLNTLIDDIDKKIRKENSDTTGGRVTQSFINMFVDLDVIKKGIPQYADAVIHEMTKKSTRRQIKAVLNKQLKNYSEQTFDLKTTPQLSLILFRTESTDIEEARIKLRNKIIATHDLIVKETALLIGLSLGLFALAGLNKQALSPSRYTLLTLSLVILLIAGVTTPTIDMEATISQMNLMLLGHPITFENQVLYFQSKSILDVFWIMMTHADIQMKLVGLLLITFSIIFPLLKIVSSLGYYFNYHHAKDNPVIKFFVLKSGKWSMADVMVIAIFMAYIGFNGIITSQLGHLNSKGQELVVITTNGTSLQPGFYLFLTFSILALFLSEFLTRNPPELSVPVKE